MMMNRREFAKGGLAALGFLALDGLPVFAAPVGWKPKKKPNLGGRQCELKAVEVTENETTVTKLVLKINPIGLVLMVR